MQHPGTDTADARQPPRKRPPVKRRPAHTKLDGRSWEYLLLVKTRADLTAHVGGAPSAAERVLIERAAWLTVYVAQQDAKTETKTFMSDHMSRQYLAWVNSLSKTLRHLGLKGRAERAPTLADHVARQGTRP